mmetsp:Transcript_13370/g.49673  ORF Transcript_13370/g.49673 Transcript_13370/m.49673 type:complete len:188 (-) Transcript_13370:288-851(-)
MESEGKSSLLERIASREIFPRSRSFCTRMAVKLMMRFSRHENVIELRCVDRKTRAVLMNNDGQPLERRIESTRVHQDDEDIASRIQAVIQGFIMHKHPEDNGRTVLPDEEIEVELRAPNVPTIDLVDIFGPASCSTHPRRPRRPGRLPRDTCRWSTPSCSASCPRGPRACVTMPFGRCCGKRWRAIA